MSADELSGRMDQRMTGIDAKIQKVDSELFRIKDQLARTRPGPGQNGLKRRGLQLLKQKKMYEQQREQLYGQQNTIDQVGFTAENMVMAQETVSTFKETNKIMKKQMKTLKIDDIDELYDDMEDMMDYSNELQEVMSRGFEVGEDLDDADLEAELDMLGEMDFGPSESIETSVAPSYLDAAPATSGLDDLSRDLGLPSTPSAAPSAPSAVGTFK